jgi:hypothetical protein
MVVYQNYSMGWLSQCGVDLIETTPEQNLRMLSHIQFFVLFFMDIRTQAQPARDEFHH